MWTVAALYQFRVVAEPASLQLQLQTLSRDLGLCGTLIVAPEGINGTVAGSRDAITRLHDFLLAQGFTQMEYKESLAHAQPFRRMKVKLKPEIVTLGIPVAPREVVGTYLEPEEWNRMISRPDVLVVDTRNQYEYVAGTFHNAVDPQTDTFREFPEYVENQLAGDKSRPIAMFCTGGIRCEKSTSLLLQQGFTEVYHLKGGILNYLEKISPEDSLWQGECFVFDHRTGVSNGVAEGELAPCFGCGWPVTPEQQQSAEYERGVSCPHCYHQTTADQKARFRMRQRQFDERAASQPVSPRE